MKVIFRKTQEVKEVKPGYARNYLIPQGLAVLATTAAIKKIEKQKAQEETQLKELANKLAGQSIEIPVRVGEKGKLFGAVTAQDIINHVKDKLDITLQKVQIVLEKPIKELGKYNIEIRVVKDLKARIKVKIVAKK